MRRLALALLLALPAAAVAQPVRVEPPDPGSALAHLHRPEGDLEQVYVLPERAGQNQVAWYPFDWQYVDVPAPDGGKGGLRLYYYRSASAQAERALPAIRSAYARLVAEFAYSPTRRIPYILYGTQREFQTSNVFQVSESVLGVTSPSDLKMSVPYFGDHGRFLEVSTHEMVHQFTIQKLMDAAGGDAWASAIQRLPLWFIEGIAEYYTKGGIDPETDEYLRDLVWNPEPTRRYEVLPFTEDRLRGYIPTYKLGQARIAFIAEAYGREKIQALLENAELVPDPQSSGGKGFDQLVRRVLGEPAEQVDARWRAWLKRRYFPEYGRTRQDLPQFRELRGLSGEPEAFVASPDGQVVFVRVLDRERGHARLLLADLRNPKESLTVARDDEPGSESLHPIDYGTLAIGDGLLAWSAQSGPGDVLTVQAWRKDPSARRPRVQLGVARRLELRAPGGGPFVRIADPAFSPDQKELAFVGVAADGQQDLYVVPVAGGAPRRLSDDAFAKRDLAWGADGIYLSSDATDHGRHNLFRVDPVSGAWTRLTTWPADDRHPCPLRGGRPAGAAEGAPGAVVFSTTGHGKVDLAVLEDGAVRPLTDFTTVLTWPAQGPGGSGLLAITFHGGTFRLVEVPRLAWLTEPAVPVAPPAGAVLPIPRAELPSRVVPYRPLQLSNWRPEAGMIFGGGSAAGINGRAAVLFEDFLRDQALVLDVSVLGSFDLTQALALYQNRAGRVPWTLGAYHLGQLQFDQNDYNLSYNQRDFGLLGALDFPLDRYRRVEAELSLGATERYCLTDTAGKTYWSEVVPCGGYNDTRPGDPAGLTAAWRSTYGGLHGVVGPVLRLGYDSVHLDRYTGPLAGTSALLELGGGWIPDQRAVHGFTRLELARWWQLIGRANLMFRLAGAASFAGNETGRIWARTWWVSAPDNLRGYTPYDSPYLVGRAYYLSNLELQFPLDAIIRLFFFDQIEAVAALDFGGVFNHLETRVQGTAGADEQCLFATTDRPDTCIDPGAWDARTLSGVLGINLLLGPVVLRLHWGHPFDIGGMRTPALREHVRWVTNLSLAYAFF